MDMKQSFDEGTAEHATAMENGDRDTIATFIDSVSLISETVSVCVPGRGRAAVVVSWDPCAEMTGIGQTTMAYLCPSPLIYTTRQASNLYEMHPTNGTVLRWRSTWSRSLLKGAISCAK